MLFLSALDICTWALTGLVILFAYILGAAHSHDAPSAGGSGKPTCMPPEANAAPREEQREQKEAGSLVTVRTKTLADQSSEARGDGERAPQTPARSLAPSLGNREESEEHSEDGEPESRHEARDGVIEEVRPVEAGEAGNGMGADATAFGAQLAEPTPVEDTVVTKEAVANFSRRKIVPRQVHELVVVHFRDEREVTVRETELSVDKGAQGLKLKSSEVERRDQEAATKEKNSRLVRTSKPEAAALLPRVRMTSDGIPVVDVSRGSSVSNGRGGSSGTTEKVKESSLKKGTGTAWSIMRKSPSRTTSNSSERERVSVLYSSPPASLSLKSPHHTPRGNDHIAAPEADGWGRASAAGGRMGGAYGAMSPVGNQRQQHSNAERQRVGVWDNLENMENHNQTITASPYHVGSGAGSFGGVPASTSRATDTSPISTISSISSALSPGHRRNESENTKLEGAWMVASKAAAELGIGASDCPAGGHTGQEDGIPMASNAASPWEMSWGNPMAHSDTMLGVSDSLSNLGSSSLSTATTGTTDRSNHDGAHQGLDLYSSISSLSWANSNSLSSYGSSLHRSSMSDRPDVFNTIKGIWGENNEPEEGRLP